jgi:SAM-dependent methyltransferase
VPAAPDGSSVELYRLLPDLGEAALIHDAAPPGPLLELGCGAGRVTRGLLARGRAVVAVDESAEMLAEVRGAETVRARIEGLDLGRRFAGVVLGSHLVNVPDPAERRALLGTCARHVAPDGVVLVERHEPGWSPVAGVVGMAGEVETALDEVALDGPLVTATARYRAGGREWAHPFTARVLDDAETAAALAEVGLALARTLGPRGRWVLAVPRGATAED